MQQCIKAPNHEFEAEPIVHHMDTRAENKKSRSYADICNVRTSSNSVTTWPVIAESFDINFLYQVLPSDLFGGVLSDLPSDLHLGDQFIPFPSELSHAAVLDAKPAEVWLDV